MAAQDFRVIFTESAWGDIREIVGYWTDRNEPERGEQYAHDLPAEAIRQLSDAGTAREGRHLRPRPIRRRKSCRSSSARIASFTS
jgi:plasmid stabilization system protein ParE